ncbi:hypothetical protein [Rhodococcus sp. IEGM1428]|uniref:hypothetical protein n=1 Tax=Rhodococcus sp. IEGM1428 TaxID=3392191 RepID=UPI003D11E0F0
MRLERKAYDDRDFTLVEVGAELPVETVMVEYTDVVAGAVSTGTYFRGHIDPAYATRQNKRGIYLATGSINGLLDAYVARWCGPRAFLRRRSVTMKGSICAGDTITYGGVVRSFERAECPVAQQVPTDAELIGIDVTIINQAGETCVRAQVSMQIPVRTAR